MLKVLIFIISKKQLIKKQVAYMLLISVIIMVAVIPASAASAPGDTYKFSTGFSSVQGQNQWYYKQWNGTSYSNMTWDAAYGRWQGSYTYNVISKGSAHTDTNDSVIAWQAPKAGTVTIRGMMESNSEYNQGDGVLCKIMKQNGSTVTQVWPSSGWQEIKPNFMAQHIFQVTVAQNDFIYFQVNKNGNNSYDTTQWDPVISYTDNPKFTLDKAEVVMTPADCRNVGFKYCFDSSVSIVPNGTNLDFYHSEDGGSIVQKWRGTLAQPAQTSIYIKNALPNNPHNVDGNWWICNMYKDTDGGLLAFCHLEWCTSNGFWALGLAYSSDGGNTFTKLGKIVTQYTPDGTPGNVNIFGCPYVINNGYFYVYYGDNISGNGTPTVVRAPVADVLAAAKAGNVTSWNKYYYGTWNEPGLGGNASRVLPYNAKFGAATHGDAAYSSYLGKYVMSGYNHGQGKGMWLTFSDDGVNWEPLSWIQNSCNPAR